MNITLGGCEVKKLKNPSIPFDWHSHRQGLSLSQISLRNGFNSNVSFCKVVVKRFPDKSKLESSGKPENVSRRMDDKLKLKRWNIIQH